MIETDKEKGKILSSLIGFVKTQIRVSALRYTFLFNTSLDSPTQYQYIRKVHARVCMKKLIVLMANVCKSFSLFLKCLLAFLLIIFSDYPILSLAFMINSRTRGQINETEDS